MTNNEVSKAELLKKWKLKTAQSKSDSATTEITTNVAHSAERRIYLLQKINASGNHYHYAQLFEFKGDLDIPQLVDAISAVWKKNDGLRKNYYLDNHQVKYSVKDYQADSFTTKHIVLDSLEKVERRAKEISLAPYNLESDDLARFVVYSIGPSHHILLVTMHHIIGDRWSLELLKKDIFSAYQGEELEHVAIPYQKENTSEKGLQYWVEKLQGKNSNISLPSIKSRPKKVTYTGNRIHLSLNKNTSAAIIQSAKNLDFTIFHFILSSLNVLLHKYTDAKELNIGTPISIRDNLDLEKSIGFYTESITLNNTVHPQSSFDNFAESVKSSFISDLSYKNVPFDEIVKALKISREGNINPLYQIMYIHEMDMDGVLSLPNLQITDKELYLETAKVDATVFSRIKENKIELTLEYCTEIYDEISMQRMLVHLSNILDCVSSNPEVKIADIDWLSVEEKKLLLDDLQGVKPSTPAKVPIHTLISRWSNDRPDHTAVSDGINSITYFELSNRSDILASLLSATDSKKPVALLMDRSIDYVIAIVASLKCGRGYIPLDKSYPIERIKYILNHAEVSSVIMNSADDEKILSSQFKYRKIHFTEIDFSTNQNYISEVDMSDLAYAIYTSGSTGKPKGVPISHNNLWISLMSRYEFYPNRPETFLLMSSFAFDSSVAGIYWTLTTGGTLVISPNRIEQDLDALGQLITSHKITHTLLLPSLYNSLLSYGKVSLYNSLTDVIVAGESCPSSLVKLHYEKLSNSTLYNEYGPTEGTVWSIATTLQKDNKVSIGNAIPYYYIYVLDTNQKPVPIGVEGEIYIGGEGVARGYLQDEHETRKRFLNNPFHEGQYYRTGDLALYAEDHKIYFRGRKDFQIKVRGHRIELSEIEHALKSVEPNSQWIILPYKDQIVEKTSIIAYYIGKKIDRAQINGKLVDYIPDYMLPSHYIELTSFPRLPNGKIDQNKLKNSYSIIEKSTKEIIEPTTDREKQILAIWKKTLGKDDFGVTDNFFGLGGDSIKSIKMVSIARDQGLMLSPQSIFEYQTVRSLALEVDKTISQPKVAQKIIEHNKSELSDIQKALYFVSQSSTEDSGILELDFKLYGKIDINRFITSWQLTADRHTILKAFISEENEKITQVIGDAYPLNIEYHDLSNLSAKEQLTYLESKNKNTFVFRLDRQESNKIHLFKMDERSYIMRWICHHIFLDGMSCAIVLKDLLRLYEDPEVKFSRIYNYPTYLKWQSSTSKIEEQKYWTNELGAIDHAYLIQNKEISNRTEFCNYSYELGDYTTQKIAMFCQQEKISAAVFFQTCWTIMLSKIFQSNEVVFGKTVTGRNRDFPNVEKASGLYMNVVPEIAFITPTNNIKDWMRTTQSNQGQKIKMEHTSYNDVLKYIRWPQNRELFDTLFVFGNFMNERISIGEIDIIDFTGGFTSTYPLTLRVNPTDQSELTFLIDHHSVDQGLVEWIPKGYKNIIESVLQGAESLLDISSAPTTTIRPIAITKTEAILTLNTNATTKDRMLLIWQELFGKKDIKEHQSFFALGGKSLQSIKLVNLIEDQFKRTITPSKILEYPSIAALSKHIDSEQGESTAEVLIQMKQGKNEIPLICFHAGGSQIFFYKTFSEYLNNDIPVYSVQPPDVDSGIYPNSIEEMTSLYIREIQKIYANGPIHILATCFSNTVAMEMVNQLKSSNTRVDKILIIDSAPNTLYSQTNILHSLAPKHIWYNIKNKQLKTLLRKLRLLPQAENRVVNYTGSENEKINRSVDRLNSMYANYEWKKVDQQVDLIRTSEKVDRGLKFHIESWTDLSNNQLVTHDIKGKHIELWEGTTAKNLAKLVSKILVGNND